MRLPNKINSYKDSILFYFPLVIEPLTKRDYSVFELYKELKDKIDLYNYINVLDCLFALNEITLKEEVLHYVKRNTI